MASIRSTIDNNRKHKSTQQGLMICCLDFGPFFTFLVAEPGEDFWPPTPEHVREQQRHLQLQKAQEMEASRERFRAYTSVDSIDDIYIRESNSGESLGARTSPVQQPSPKRYYSPKDTTMAYKQQPKSILMHHHDQSRHKDYNHTTKWQDRDDYFDLKELPTSKERSKSEAKEQKRKDYFRNLIFLCPCCCCYCRCQRIPKK